MGVLKITSNELLDVQSMHMKRSKRNQIKSTTVPKLSDVVAIAATPVKRTSTNLMKIISANVQTPFTSLQSDLRCSVEVILAGLRYQRAFITYVQTEAYDFIHHNHSKV